MHEDVKATIVGFLTIVFCLLVYYAPHELLAGVGVLFALYSISIVCWLIGVVVLSVSEKFWGEGE